MSEEFGGGK